MSPGRRSGPEPKPETAETGFAATVSTILPRLAEADQSARLTETVGFIVFVELDGDHTRRSAYFTLKAAQHAVERAARRGQRARVVLCDLHPVRTIAAAAEVLP